jgi:ATP-dependent Clp protease adaptor protein ClpS
MVAMDGPPEHELSNVVHCMAVPAYGICSQAATAITMTGRNAYLAVPASGRARGNDEHGVPAAMRDVQLVMMAGRNGGGSRQDEDRRTDLVTKTKPKTKKPSLYKVLLLNDDYTPMEFVVYVLERFFNKGREDATRIMLHVHHKGVGVCGVYTYEIAETKVAQVMDLARQNGHPLQCTMEKE